MKILIIEDDNDISQMLRELLTNENYSVNQAYSGTEALLLIERETFDLVLLDLMLPGLSGQEVMKQLRKNSYIPVICISAKDDKETKIELLKLGADDYIVKPFDTDELLARIEAQLRRYYAFSETKTTLNYAGLAMDADAMEVRLNHQMLTLTKREFQILELLMKYPRKVFTKANLYEHVWNDEFLGDDNTVNVHMSNLRNKLKEIDDTQEYIQTVWGIGFKMADIVSKDEL